MKKIEAIIRKSRFEDVKEALLAADIEWFSYYDVRGEGKMRQARIYRVVMYNTSSIERRLVLLVVHDVPCKPSCRQHRRARLAMVASSSSPSTMPSVFARASVAT